MCPTSIPYIIGILRHQEAGIIGLYFPVRLFLGLGFLQRRHLVLVKDDAFLLHLSRKCLQTFLKGLYVIPEPYRPYPSGDTRMPFLRNSLDTRTCPNAGLSMAICTTACSMCSSSRFFITGFFREISCKASSPPCSYSS